MMAAAVAGEKVTVQGLVGWMIVPVVVVVSAMLVASAMSALVSTLTIVMTKTAMAARHGMGTQLWLFAN